MADKKITFETEGAREAADELRKVAREAEGAGDSVEEAGEKSKGAAASTGGLTKTLGKLAIGYALVKEMIVESVKEGAKLEASQGRLNSAFSRASISARGQARVMDAAAKSTERFGVLAADANDMLSRLVATTGDAEKATKLYTLAQDIASQESMVDLQQATELLVKAQKGEVEELKNLNGLTKDQAAALGKIEDEAMRAQIAVQVLTDNYHGLAEANRGTEEEMAAFTAGVNQVQASLGNVIIESGNAGIKMLEMLGIVNKGELSIISIANAFNNFATAIGNTADNLEVFNREASASERIIQGISMTPLGWALTATGVIDTDANFEDVVARGGGTASASGNRPQTGPDGLPALDPNLFVGPLQPAGKAKERRRSGAKAKKEDSGLRDAALGAGMTYIEQEIDARKADQEAVERVTREHNERMIEIEREAQKERIANLDKELKEKKRVREDREAEALKEAEKAEAARTAAIEAGANAAAGLAKSAADSFIENEAAKAAISGAIEIARSIAAFTSGNIPGGIGHAAAAAQFGIAAAMSGKSPGGAGKNPAAAAGGGAQQRQRDNAGLIGERDRSQAFHQEAAPLIVNINSAFPPSPQQARELANAVARDGTTRVT